MARHPKKYYDLDAEGQPIPGTFNLQRYAADHPGGESMAKHNQELERMRQHSTAVAGYDHSRRAKSPYGPIGKTQPTMASRVAAEGTLGGNFL